MTPTRSPKPLRADARANYRRVLEAVCGYAKLGDGFCWASSATLAKASGLSVRTVQSAVAWWAELKVIAVQRMPSPRGMERRIWVSEVPRFEAMDRALRNGATGLPGEDRDDYEDLEAVAEAAGWTTEGQDDWGTIIQATRESSLQDDGGDAYAREVPATIYAQGEDVYAMVGGSLPLGVGHIPLAELEDPAVDGGGFIDADMPAVTCPRSNQMWYTKQLLRPYTIPLWAWAEFESDCGWRLRGEAHAEQAYWGWRNRRNGTRELSMQA